MTSLLPKVDSSQTFETWLKARLLEQVHAETIVIAYRSCLRIVFNLHKIADLDESKLGPFILERFRSLLIARSAITNLDNPIKDAAWNAGNMPPFSSTMCVVRINNPKTNVGDLARLAWEAAYASGPNNLTEFKNDLGRLENGKTAEELALQPLFEKPNQYGIESDVAKLGFSRTLEIAVGSFSIWTKWYTDAVKGHPTFGINNKLIRETLERNIALGSTDGKFNKDFWDREPALINSDIKCWVNDATVTETD